MQLQEAADFISEGLRAGEQRQDSGGGEERGARAEELYLTPAM